MEKLRNWRHQVQVMMTIELVKSLYKEYSDPQYLSPMLLNN